MYKWLSIVLVFVLLGLLKEFVCKFVDINCDKKEMIGNNLLLVFIEFLWNIKSMFVLFCFYVIIYYLCNLVLI